MANAELDDHLMLTLSLPVSRDLAFEVFTLRFGTWYPSEYTWSGSGLVSIGVEQREGGRCTETGPHGFQCDWGRVLVWQPPERLVLSWQIGFDRVPAPDPSRASEIEVRWQVEGDGLTRMDFVHRNFSRHGDQWRSYVQALSSPGGWPYILNRYVSALAMWPGGAN